MSTEILFFGTGEFPRRNFNRVADEFFGGAPMEDEGPFTGVFFADADWSATTDVAFDYVMESDFFDDEPIVLAPADEDEIDDEKLLMDLADEGAKVERYDNIYDGVLTRSDFTIAMCLFDDEDDDLAEDVMRLVEDGRIVYDVIGGMLEFDVAVEDAGGEEIPVEDDEASADEPEESLHPKVKMALDKLHEALSESDDPGDIDSKALASKIGRGAMEQAIEYLGIEQYKGMHTKTMVDEALDALWESLADTEEPDSVESPESVDSPQSVDSPESEDSPDEEYGEAEDWDDPEAYDVPERMQPVEALPARQAMAHVSFADIVALLALYDGDVDEAVEAAAAFGVTFEDAR